MSAFRRFLFFSISLVVLASEMFLSAQTTNKVKYPESIFENFMSKANIGEKSGYSDGFILMVEDGKLLYARSTTHPEKIIPLGETSGALVSLMSQNMQSARVFDGNVSVNDFFSLFRSANSNVKKASVNQLLSGRSGLPYLVEKIPQNSTPSEFLDALATMNFSLPEANISAPKISTSIAGYAMAYAENSQSKNLKKTFVACSRKYLFAPLKIENVKYRNFDKFIFPASCYALHFNEIVKWLECETSPNPVMLSTEIISERRRKIGWDNSQGWNYVKQFDAVYTQGATGGWRNCVAIFKLGRKTIALAMFLQGGKVDTTFKFFSDTIFEFNKFIKNQ